MREFLERKRLQPDLNRAARCTVAFMAPMVAAHAWNLPVEASFAAIAAQNVAMVDVRGSYPLRLSLLLAMTVILGGATWLGGIAGADLPLALAAVTGLMLAGGLWRHLNAEYGPALAIASVLLFLIALSHPGGNPVASRHFLAALGGGLWGVVVQGALWPFHAQHPLRRAVSDSWLALSDLLAALAPAGQPNTAARHLAIATRQAALRTALDQATAILAAAPSRGKHRHIADLEELNLAAARFATRLMGFNASLETLMERPDFDALAPGFEPVIVSLTNYARTIALTVVSREPSHFAKSEVRLRRLEALLQALQERVRIQTNDAPDGGQFAFILREIAALLPVLNASLRATVDRADDQSAFSLELFDLQTWTLRPLASSLNFHWRPDPALVRFVARATVLQLIGVSVFMLSDLERGYWLPLTTLMVLQPEYGATRRRAGQRLLGTLAGSLLASGLLWLALPPSVVLVELAVTMAGFTFFLKRNYTVAVFFITLFVVLITEVSTHVTLAFTLDRLVATVAGGVLALAAALLFWPLWERERFPGLLARALRGNRDYIRILGERLKAGGEYDAGIIAFKRAAETANSTVFASLERMSADPKNQQPGLKEAAALANGNQRLSQALTVIALHLDPHSSLDRPELGRFIPLAMQALEQLAVATEGGDPDPDGLVASRHALSQLSFRAPPGAATSPREHGLHGQFARCATELSAMLIAAGAGANAADAKSRAAGLPSATA